MKNETKPKKQRLLDLKFFDIPLTLMEEKLDLALFFLWKYE